MEFLDYSTVLGELKSQGVVERRAGARVALELAPNGKTLSAPHRLTLGGQPADAPGDARVVCTAAPAPREKLGALAEAILHRSHVHEAVLIPATNWGEVLGASLMQLVQDSSWLDVDAEASLEQKTRNPLSVLPREAHVVRVMAQALVDNASGPAQDLIIASTGSPLVLELRHPGELRVWCANAVVADRIKAWAAS